MFMYAVKKPAAAAAAALGEDGTAVFCEGPGLLFASARGETPDAGITTAIFNDVEKGASTTATGGSPAPGASPRSSSICPRRWAKSSPAGSRAPRS